MKTEASQDQLRQRTHRHYVEWYEGDGAQTEFLLTKSYSRSDDVLVFVNGNLMRPDIPGTAHDYALRGLTPGYDGEKNAIKFAVAPIAAEDVAVSIIAT